MAKTVFILRHAKAAHGGELQDYERPLAEEGRAEAAALAQHLQASALKPEVVYYSAAKRTSETFAILEPVVGAGYAIEALYLASAGDLLDFIHKLPDDHGSVLLVGHNPGLHQLGLILASDAKPALYEAVELGFPTCSFLQLDFEMASWTQAAPQMGEIAQFWTPGSGAMQ